jgi:hypothetical protein
LVAVTAPAWVPVTVRLFTLTSPPETVATILGVLYTFILFLIKNNSIPKDASQNKNMGFFIPLRGTETST